MPSTMPELDELEVRLANPYQMSKFNETMHNVFFEGWPVSREELDLGFKELDNHSTRRDGRCLTWVLVKSDDREGEAYSFTQTLRRVGLVRRPGESLIEKDWFYSIQSVCTPRQYRRKGYSRHLLRILHYILSPTHLPPYLPSLGPPIPSVDRTLVPLAFGSILSSDLSPGWYEKCYIGPSELGRLGWVSKDDHSNTDLYYDIPIDIKKNNLEIEVGESGWKFQFLYASDYEVLGPILSKALRERLKEKRDDGKTMWAIPDPNDSGWLTHHEIFSRIRASRLQRTTTNQDVPIGVRFYQPQSQLSSSSLTSTPCSPPPSLSPTDPIILFAPNAYFRRPTEFPITLICNVDPPLVPHLLSICSSLGQEAGANHLRAWGWSRDSDLVKEWVRLGGKVESRVENRKVPYGFAWYGPPGTKGELIGCEMWAFT